jgi:tetratricopeptide (TPR) repeat protein
VLLLAATPAAFAETAQQNFYQAFYLEKGLGDFAAAAKLYSVVARDGDAEAKFRRLARIHLAACREEIASSDFAALMPADAWAYVELNRPGDQLMSLLKQLGLLADPEEAAAEAGKRVAVSPALVKELLGMRGAAAAITGFDPETEIPTGVVVIHPGDLEVVRGLIETALPVGGTPVEPIGGYATYDVEGEAFVTLTKRLVIASQQRSEIEGVIARLAGKGESLADNADLTEVLKDRADSLLFFCVNAKPVLPLLKKQLAREAGDSHEVAMAMALLDPDSLKSFSGRAGVSDDGLFLEVALSLDKGHRNLIFNFMRMPAIDEETLRCIPSGAAGFFAMALNESTSRYNATGEGEGEPPIVTGLDFFREIFANIVGISVYVLPPDGSSERGGPPIPDVAVAITVHDPSKSEALWTQMLGIASMATGQGVMEGETVKIAGVEARSFKLPEGVTIYFATLENELLISPKKSALARSIKAKRNGDSIMKDKAFAKSLERLGPHSTLATFAHAGRCMAIAKQFMSDHEIEEMEQFAPLLSDTVAALVVEHSGQTLRLSWQVTGIPDVSGLVTGLVMQQRAAQDARRVGRRRQAEVRQAVAEADGPKALERALVMLDDAIVEQPKDAKLLQSKFDLLALKKKDRDAALAFGEEVLERAADDASFLNNLAWYLLTEDKYDGRYNELALKLSERSNKITDQKNWVFVDTLALARFEAGDVKDAIRLQKKAIKLSKGASAEELKGRLARFEAAAEATAAKTAADDDDDSW